MSTRTLNSLLRVTAMIASFSCSSTSWAQAPQFTAIQLLTNKEVALNFAATTGHTYRIEAANSNLNWNSLVTFSTNVATSLQHTDSATPFLQSRFYRASQLTGTNIVAGDHLATTNGDVVIRPLFHASFVMQWNGKTIYNDPDDDLDYLTNYNGLPKADLILISHNHGDHLSTAQIDAVRAPGAQIIASPFVYNNNLTASQRAITIPLTNGASTNVLGMTIEAVPAYNANHVAGQCNGYVLTIGGKRIYATGDTGNTAQMRALTNIDVAFLCINQPFTMTVNDATNAARAFRPKVIYPYHYRDSTGATTNATVFKQRLGTDLGIEVRLRQWY